ncbi:MAG: hypothetical protein V3G42_09290 [Oscillospiraceae bacterium]
MSKENHSELSRNEHTEYVYDATCFGEPVFPETADDVTEGIQRALEMESGSAFLEGLSERLRQLGIECTAEDTDIMLMEVKRRFKLMLGKSCPKAVQNWIRGITPGVTNRLNNYDLCYALEMDFQQTAIFFQKHYLTIPFHCKSKTDAVFMYCLYHHKSYAVIRQMLEKSEGFVPQENAHTATSQIFSEILSINGDDKLINYLSQHCYDNQQQFQLARSVINQEIKLVKESILKDTTIEIVSENRLNSLTIAALLGYRYQSREIRQNSRQLPKRFTESLPNDVTLGRIINGESISYEVLRKTLMLLKFYNFYHEARNTDHNVIAQNLMDFYDELNNTLISCGFAQIYVRHPFDCLLLYCANSYDPILTMYLVNE